METEKKKISPIKIIIPVLIAVIIIAVLVGVMLNNKKINETVSLSGVYTAEELAKLDKYVNLASLDAGGSDCYDALMEYGSTHPNVDLSYTVEADGLVIGNKDTAIDISGHDTAKVMAMAEYLPAVSEIELGETALSADELAALSESFNGAALSYSFSALGKSFDKNTAAVDFSALTPAQVGEAAETLRKLPAVSSVKLGSGIEFADYAELFEAAPEADFDYSFELFGQTVTTHTDTLKYKKQLIGDEGIRQMYDYLPYLPNLSYLSFDRCETTDETVAALRDAFPDVKIVWRIFFGPFTVMTDVQKIWAIGCLTDDIAVPLKYCTDVKYMDVGHNDLTDISFIENMPNLEVAIFSINPHLRDISPIVNCQKLEFFEICATAVDDISYVAQVPNIQHIHFGANTVLSDISPLYDMPNLKRVYMSDAYKVKQEQVDKLRELHPDCDINNDESTMPLWTGTWRFTGGLAGEFSERYALLRLQIGYDDPQGDSRLYNDF